MKGKLGTILVIIATIGLAGAAIFTAIRLYQLRSEPVAPNVPESIPQAQEINCSLSFTRSTATTPPGAVVCTNKTAYKDIAGNAPNSYDTSSANKLASGASVAPEQKIVYVVQPGPEDIAKSITITDILPASVTFLDSDDACTYTSATRTVSCTLESTSTQSAYRVTINDDAEGTITNTATVQGEGDTASTCSTSLVVSSSTASPTPTPTPTTPGSTPPTPTSPPAGGTSTPAPALPESGIAWPTVVSAGLGILVILGALLLAF